MVKRVDGDSAVRNLLASLAPHEQQIWLAILLACYETAGHVPDGEFAKAWVPGLRGVPMNLKRLERHGILMNAGSTRRKRRAYWRMLDRDGVGKALMAMKVLEDPERPRSIGRILDVSFAGSTVDA
jgi:hypothetical protein